MRKYLAVKTAAVLMCAGLLVGAIGFAMSGFNPNHYAQYENHWYSIVHIR